MIFGIMNGSSSRHNDDMKKLFHLFSSGKLDFHKRDGYNKKRTFIEEDKAEIEILLFSNNYHTQTT